MQSLVHPLSLRQFDEKVVAQETFVIEGHADKFSHLITLDEIEARLNDGCNTASPVQIIKDGGRERFVTERLFWAPQATKKREVLKLLQERHSFMMTNMSQINHRVAELLNGIERFFTNAHADLHLYVSTRSDASGYRAHRDRPQHKLYLQIIGCTAWKIFRPRVRLDDKIAWVDAAQEQDVLEPTMAFDLHPGDLLYMPPEVFHRVHNRGGPRVSFSIPFTIVPDEVPVKRMDRTHIPFKEMFLADVAKHNADVARA